MSIPSGRLLVKFVNLKLVFFALSPYFSWWSWWKNSLCERGFIIHGAIILFYSETLYLPWCCTFHVKSNGFQCEMSVYTAIAELCVYVHCHCTWMKLSLSSIQYDVYKWVYMYMFASISFCTESIVLDMNPLALKENRFANSSFVYVNSLSQRTRQRRRKKNKVISRDRENNNREKEQPVREIVLQTQEHICSVYLIELRFVQSSNVQKFIYRCLFVW